MPKRRASITATSLSGGGRGARLIGPEANGFGVGELCYTEKLDHCVRRSARFTPPTATPGEAGTRECSCVLPDRSEVRFTIEGDPVCPNVLDACLNDRFDREGPRRCVFLDSGADELGCHIWRECSRDASFDGASITLREQLLVSCGSVLRRRVGV